MDDPLDMRDELETESLIDLEARPDTKAERSDRPCDDVEDHPLSLFSNREDEPEGDDSAESPIDLLMKSGQPRLSLVRGEDELDDDGGLIELAPADPIPTDAEIVADTWPWLADVESTSADSDDESPLLRSLEAQFDSDMIAPTACGARPTSLEVNRRPMPSLPRPGEIASVAQRVGAQFAGDVRVHRTPDVPALLTTMPKTFTPAPPVKTSGDRPAITRMPALAPTPDAVSVPASAVASIAISPVTVSTSAMNSSIPSMSSMPAATVITGPSAPVASRKSPDTPKRIGDGKLVQSRLTWKPGDPFAERARSAGMPSRFRWELMLSTACGTAVFGLAFFWIMRMVF